MTTHRFEGYQNRKKNTGVLFTPAKEEDDKPTVAGVSLSSCTFERPRGVDAPAVARQRFGMQTPLVQHVSLRDVAEGSHKRVRNRKPETDLSKKKKRCIRRAWHSLRVEAAT